MNTNNKNIRPWIIAGCSILVIFACMATAVTGAAGMWIARRVIQNVRQHTVVSPVGENLSPRAAVLQDLRGWVEFSGEKGDWSPAIEGMQITAGQSVRTGALSSASLLFNDGSRANLKSGAEIALDEVDAGSSGRPRTILLTQVLGESTHQVSPTAGSGSRYEVSTPYGSGAAKGTEFVVLVSPENTAYYYVLEGVVAVNGAETTVLVNPGFMTIIFFDQPPLAPVQIVSVEGIVSQAGEEWVVAGTTYTVDENTVISGDPQVGDWAVVKGHVFEDNNIADWIILVHRAAANRFSLAGVVDTVDGDMWTVNGQAIVVGEGADVDEGIQQGSRVYVTGIIDGNGELQAEKVERVDEEQGLPFTFSGIVQTNVDPTWQISGVTITTAADTQIDEDIEPGKTVTVRGHIQENGDWLADEITQLADEENGFTLTGELESKDPWKVAGITFETAAGAAIPAGLSPGDTIRVTGYINDAGQWIATAIERVDNEAARMVIIGTVITRDPWVVSGIPLTLAPGAEIAEGISPGMLVRVELVMQLDGSWQVVKIELLNSVPRFTGCVDVVATVIGVNGNQLQLENWPAVSLGEAVTVEGTLTPGSIIRIRICFSEDGIQVVYIVILQPGEVEPPVGDEGEKVTVCHKPDKKGGHTLSIGRPALPAHLGHGDYVGTCR